MLKKLSLLSLLLLTSLSVFAEVKVKTKWDRKEDEIIKVMPVDENNKACIEYFNGMSVEVTVQDKDGRAAMEVVVYLDKAGEKVEHMRSIIEADWNKEVTIKCASDDHEFALSVTALQV